MKAYARAAGKVPLGGVNVFWFLVAQGTGFRRVHRHMRR